MPWYDVRNIAAFVTRSVGLVTTNVRPRGTDRDQHGLMILIAYALALTATWSCQQGDRREAAGEVAATLPARPAPVPTADLDLRAAQVDLAEGRAWLATRKVVPLLRAPARRSPEAGLVAARA